MGTEVKWTKFSDKWPGTPEDILYFDHKTGRIILAFKMRDNSYAAEPFYCNDPECSWIYDDCCCKLVISLEDQWMYVPNAPKED
jgi:hypothetical protein